MVVTCFFVICTFGAIKYKQPERHMDERDNEGKNPSCLLSQTCHQKETRRLYREGEFAKVLVKTSRSHAMKLILVVNRLLSFLRLLSLLLSPDKFSKKSFLYHSCFFSTCNQILSPSESEDVPVEDWHQYEHVEGD